MRNPFQPASSHQTLLIKSALELVFAGRVSHVDLKRPTVDALLIRARVLEKQKFPYRVQLKFVLSENGDAQSFQSFCNCYAHERCKHAAAVLIYLLKQPEAKKLPSVVASWFQGINDDLNSLNVNEALIRYTLVMPEEFSKLPTVHLHKVKASRQGKLTVDEELHLDAETIALVKNPIDQQVLEALRKESLTKESFTLTQGYPLSNAVILHALVQSKRCFFNNKGLKPLSWGAKKTAKLEWVLTKKAEQVLSIKTESEHDHVFLVEKPFYFNRTLGEVGDLSLPLEPSILKPLLLAKPIPIEKIKAVSQRLLPLIGESLLPKELSVDKVIDNLSPVARLNFKTFDLFENQKNAISYQIQGQVIGVELYFVYQGCELLFQKNSAHSKLFFMKRGKLIEIKRKLEQEEKLFEQLDQKLLLKPLSEHYQVKSSVADRPHFYLISNEWFLQDKEFFLNEGVSHLEELGFIVSTDLMTFKTIYNEQQGQWLSEIIPSTEGFFNLELGLEFEGKKISLLPLLLDLLKKYDLSELLLIEDDLPLTLSIDANSKLKIKIGRIKPLLSVLGDLIERQMTKSDSALTLSKADAGLLYEMDKASSIIDLRWLDKDKLRLLGQRLVDAKEIKEVKPPANFKATLRDYQLSGLSWLQFLREHEFGGVLADEMGLGKTIQTLAHLLIEKNEKRLTRPCLIVAPTSLMSNWALECERFAPNLKFIIHHGDKRDRGVDFGAYDLVFTTYALIARDKDLFLTHEFYYLILDEAQNIKNAATKTTQILLQFKAIHRLCLTGTPIENHLGELWSLFNFLMPGYLHDKNSFNREFRVPIEKENDEDKRTLLYQKIKPFLLRRIKKDVAMELPEKTESVISVELTGQQREIYESIRLSMQDKVRNALRVNGLNKSHIIILDALLRLRQTCCSPKLLKMSGGMEANAQKVEALFELLPTLILEGRKILLFSQFASMIELLEAEMDKNEIPFVTLTGKTKNRAEIIERFRTTDVPVFLISLKAGGTGLNLTEADVVIHFDPWWNPQVENQATDRSHRIGQTKPVFVYKLICKDTVEEVILNMQAKKSALVDDLLSLNKGQSLKLNVDDVKALFDL